MFKPYIIDTINGVKIGIIGYTKVESTMGLPSDNFVSIVKCVWADNDPTTFNLRDTVAALRNTYHCDMVVLISHETQSQLFSGASDAVIIDDGVVKPPEVVISGHWHTWTPTYGVRLFFTARQSWRKPRPIWNISARYISTRLAHAILALKNTRSSAIPSPRYERADTHFQLDGRIQCKITPA